MLSSISPLGERARGQRWIVTCSSHLAGSTLAGGGLGALLGAAGAFVMPSARGALLVALALGALWGLLADRGVLGLRVPGPRRQVNENWLARYRGWVYGGGFGLQLGLGVITIVSATITYLAFVLALMSSSPLFGGIIGGVFGLVRALPVLTTARVRDGTTLRAVVRRLHGSLAAMQSIVTTMYVVIIASATTMAAQS